MRSWYIVSISIMYPQRKFISRFLYLLFYRKIQNLQFSPSSCYFIVISGLIFWNVTFCPAVYLYAKIALLLVLLLINDKPQRGIFINVEKSFRVRMDEVLHSSKCRPRQCVSILKSMYIVISPVNKLQYLRSIRIMGQSRIAFTGYPPLSTKH